MKRAIWVLFAFAALAAPLSIFAAFHKGQTLEHILSVCLVKQDAIDVVKAEEKSREEAEKVFGEKEKCANVPVIGAKVGEVVFTGKAKVVELKAGDEVIGYFLTSQPVSDYKPERNS